MKVDVFMPLKSKYRALHAFSRMLCEAFSRQGFACRLIEVPDYFTLPVQDPPDLTFAINGVPFNESRRMLCDIIGVPHFSYIIDPPYRFYELLSSDKMIIGCDDRYGCEFLEGLHFDNTFFMPHGVDKNLSALPGQSRDIDVLMLASFIDYAALRDQWRAVLPKIVSQVMDDAIDLTFSDIKTSFIEAYARCYKDRLGLEEAPDPVGEDFVLPLVLLERYVKGKERTELVKSIKGASVLVYNGHPDGEPGWEKVLGDDYPNIVLHEPVNYEEGLEAMKRSKIVLNSFIKNKEGTHDRVLNALACGALPLTNENLFMNKHFQDEENILFFTCGSLDGVNEKIMRYLSHETEREEVAAKGREIVMAGHTWDHRVQSLIKALPDLLGSLGY